MEQQRHTHNRQLNINTITPQNMKHLSAIFALILPLTLWAGAPVSKEILLGKFNPSENTHFTRIDNSHTDKTDIYLQTEVYNAYKQMRQAALTDGITLTIVSATRTFNSQLAIWNRKWNRTEGSDSLRVRRIMRYSSMPGTSRHHWGTDIDFISVETDYWTHGSGLKAYKWLVANAPKYGFYQPYTANPGRTGYAEERWHWSYYPIADRYTQAYQYTITDADINGFPGAGLIRHLNIVQSHVLGIDPSPTPSGNATPK